MNKIQSVVIVIALLLFGFLYLGLDTKPKERKSVEQSRALVAESTNIKVLLKEAKKALPVQARNEIQGMETLMTQVDTDSLKIQEMERIAGWWYTAKRADISGYYAEQIAEHKGTETAWSLAATTYSLCIKNAQNEKSRSYCAGRAVKAYENAISLNPENVSHKMNLALSYADFPPKENPMKGVLMLLDLNKQNPENVPVILNLAKLGMKTGQFDKAIQRLEKAETLDAENNQVKCLLAEAFLQKGDQEKAQVYLEKCKKNKN